MGSAIKETLLLLIQTHVLIVVRRTKKEKEGKKELHIGDNVRCNVCRFP